LPGCCVRSRVLSNRRRPHRRRPPAER
jgi:hypothetical protein